MEAAILGSCLCACGAVCSLWRRGGGEVGRRLRRILVAVCVVASCICFYFSLSSSPAIVVEGFPQFRASAVNCSLTPLPKESLLGEVGVVTRHQWFHAVGYSLDDLRLHWAFPLKPGTEDTTAFLKRDFNQKAWKAVGGKYAHRIFGYLLPPVTGDYVFQVSLSETTAQVTVEFWLSPTFLPQQSVLLASTSLSSRKRRSKSAKSQEVFLQSCGVYYFEFLEQSYNGRAVAEVMWKLPGTWEFSEVPSSALANVKTSKADLFKNLQLPTMVLQRHKKQVFVGDTTTSVTELKVLSDCDYQSVNAYSHQLKQYWGHKELIWSHIYPSGDTGTPLVTQTFAQKILDMYCKAFNKSSYHRGMVLGIHYMDTTENTKNKYLDKSNSHVVAGTRILLELDIQLEGETQVLHTSEYMYLPAGANSLCHTSNFQWKRDVDVYLVVSVKNLGVWVQHLIHNMEHIYKVTRDEKFELVIVDYQSEDLDVEAELRASSLPRWKVISKIGGFSRSGGLQAGIDYVTDPDAIVMTIDMHLTLPPGFVEYTRRHVVQGKMGFAPMFYRLNEGRTEVTRAGFWETLTYGLLGLYKSDWTASGGFNVEKYTTKWGGEDWDAVDSIRSKGLELFRLGYPGLVHYYHSRAGMWGH